MPKSPNFPITGIKSAQGLSGAILQDYVFASGIHDVEHSNILSYKYPQYLLTAILERIGRYEGISADTWSWNEMDRTRLGATITAVGAAGSATVTVTTDLPYTADAPGYFLINDIVRLPGGKNARVTAIGNSTTFQTLTLTKIDGTNWAAGDLTTSAATGNAIGHIGSSFGEYSDAPKGRLFLPGERWNQTSILRRSCTVSGSELTNKTRLGSGKAWYYTQEEIMMKEFARDRELAILLGEKSPSGATIKTGEGILNVVEAEGTTTFYTGAVTETALQTHIKKLLIASDASEYFVPAGADYMSDVTVALKDYFLDGGVQYGTFGSVDMVGLEVQSYKFLGKKLNFVHYPLFDDVAVFPHKTASTSLKNYSNAALFLDMGKDSSGADLIKMKYKELDGVQRKLVHGYEIGMVGPGKSGGEIANAKDGFSSHLLSEIGVEIRTPNRHGFMRANG